MADIINANGSYVSVIRTSMIETISELPNEVELDLDALAAQWPGSE